MFPPVLPGLFGDGPGACISWAAHGPIEGFHTVFDSFGNVVYQAPCTKGQALQQAERFQFSVFDQVAVPSDLPGGEYVLSFRLDAEQTPQVWTHCADIRVTVKSSTTTEEDEPSAQTTLKQHYEDELSAQTRQKQHYEDEPSAQTRQKQHYRDGSDDGMSRKVATASEVAAERNALFDLARMTHIDNWVHKEGWLSSSSVCDWELVGCDSAGRVKLLTLDFNGFNGTLAASLGALSMLQDLDLEGNHLHGVLPASLGSLRALRQLGLGGGSSSFDGVLPAVLCAPLNTIVEATTDRQPGPACDLHGSVFACPLPCTAAAACGAQCES